jgi:hypothetical protein
MPLKLVLILLPLAFLAVALCFRKNPLKGAKTLDQLESWYHTERLRFFGK